MKNITGEKPLQVICSASYFEIDEESRREIEKFSTPEFIIELHWVFRRELAEMKSRRQVTGLVGVETFDINFRNYLNKSMPDVPPEEIAKYFDWVNIIFGMENQTIDMLKKDVEIALKHFKRMNLNIFCPNSTAIKRDNRLIEEFYTSDFFKEIKGNSRIDILDYEDERAPDNIGKLASKNDSE